ncbi:MAG: 16S rRNA (guanine(966)-N(2))-methyltransferase RsmD [Myxococcota bacterium]
MRIISGTHRGRHLKSFKGEGLRPTSDRVREAYFNIIGQYFVDVSVLDLYCGTGAIGLEFLSRGAGRAVFVDISKESISLARENARIMNLLSRSVFFTISASEYISNLVKETFDFIFIDPPYRENISNSVIAKINENILRENGILTIEHSKRIEYPDTIGKLYLNKKRRFGDTVLSFYSFNPLNFKE